MRKIIMIITIISLVSLLGTIKVYAHSGGTDSSGGHYNHDTGEYHYHHGYSAHQHKNGECPYQRTNSSNIASRIADIICAVIGIALAILIFPASLWEHLWKRHKRKQQEKKQKKEDELWENWENNN